MDKMRAEGAGQKMAGKAKETAGKLTGDSKLKAEGKADQVAGSVKNAIGGMKDSVKDAERKARH
ncbi:MAG: CsbD family protein [Caulobacteraceae bacterium]